MVDEKVAGWWTQRERNWAIPIIIGRQWEEEWRRKFGIGNRRRQSDKREGGREREEVNTGSRRWVNSLLEETE
jgi:hypothetical protein